MSSIDELVRIMQASIAPVTLISGVGLLLLSMTNRYARVIDRTRGLSENLTQDPEADPARYAVALEEIKILYRRAVLLRSAVILASASIFCASVAIAGLFAAQLLALSFRAVVVTSFFLSLLTLIVSLVQFIRDITVSLRALELAAQRHLAL